MQVISFTRQKFGVSWSAIVVVCAGVVAYVASAGHPHRSITHAASTLSGIAIVLFALATPLREISAVVQKWTTAVGMTALGACFGLFTRLFTG